MHLVAYPPGYRGAGGTLRVSVGIDPTSPHAREMAPSVRNIVATFNGLRPTTGNLVLGAGNDVPANHFDFESVALHEVGHALGLAHPNAGTESGLSEEEQDYTRSTEGPNGRFDLDPGADSVIGSSDDVRGDDVNLHWFRRSNNNPFTIASRVDRTTYWRGKLDLPAGHRFAANADRTVGSRLGVTNTEAVMQQGIFADEAQRTLGHDDVAGLRYAMAGVDERVGTGDDFVLVLEYAGLDGSADIVLGFDDSRTSFAAARTRALVDGGRAFIEDSSVYFNDSFNWFFNGDGGSGGGGGPDLVVKSAAVSDSTLTPGQSFTFAATVRNWGDEASAATTLNYRRRPRGGAFTVVDVDPVGGLSPSAASEESVLLRAATQVGSYEYEACVVAVSRESDTGNNCSTIVSVTVSSGGGGCTTGLGVVSGTVTRTGSWDGSCASLHYANGRYARYYDFTLSSSASVTIDLSSSVDTLLALRNGSGTGSGLIAEDDDGGPGANSRITRALAAGTYTIEATTFSPRRTGSFTLTLVADAEGAGPDLVVQSPRVSDATLTWGQSFMFSTTVRNRGDRASAAATLTYRQRRTGESWTVVGTDSVRALSPSGSSVESIGLSAPAEGGSYEYGACVSTVRGESETANNCSDPVQVRVCVVERLGSVTAGRRAGSWDSGCESTHRRGSYARYYSFVLTRAVEVAISLASSGDTYLFLLAGAGTDGRVVASNDNIGPGELNSRIVRRLSAGTYTVEATTVSAGATGSFTLRVTERRPFTDDPVEAGLSIKAVHLTELRGRLDELRVSARLSRYSWVDRTIRPGVTPIRAVHWQQLRTALDEAYDADGRRRPRYTAAIEAGVPIEAGHLNELRRAVEGL